MLYIGRECVIEGTVISCLYECESEGEGRESMMDLGLLQLGWLCSQLVPLSSLIINDAFIHLHSELPHSGPFRPFPSRPVLAESAFRVIIPLWACCGRVEKPPPAPGD